MKFNILPAGKEKYAEFSFSITEQGKEGTIWRHDKLITGTTGARCLFICLFSISSPTRIQALWK